MEFKCSKCGNTTYFLKEKGASTGVFCNKCERWAMWIPKQTIPLWEKGAQRFLKLNSLLPIPELNITGPKGASDNDPKGPLGPRARLPRDIPAERIFAELKAIHQRFTEINALMTDAVQEAQDLTECVEYYNGILEEREGQDNNPPWEENNESF